MSQKTAAPLSFADNVLATPEEAATLIKMKATTLQKWRSTGENNIPFVKIGRNVRYRVTHSFLIKSLLTYCKM